jgi:hypothetical protein
MKLLLRDSPRAFRVGKNEEIEIHDQGDVCLETNEQLTFVTPSGPRYDFVRKDWGYYATPSINSRLAHEGFKTALVKNKHDRLYVMVVEKTKLSAFEDYCVSEEQTILSWLDEHPVMGE